ncbi:sterol desaturase family protein [Rhodoferax sp.]|uniref:sterol desaturase family protein n=1 Tax=Rhodoferax sp. TaxID=50421 RepID=UPI0027278741|nr:sterol desaturase family protein [Rhodoferax sp.]MDO9198353.1 sterol desaturase family protein [Rhodoferax sp.]
MDFLGNAFSDAQQWLFETLIQPVMFALGLADLLVDGYDATGWLLVGLIQMAVLVTLIGPLQRWRPVEAVTDHAAVRTDMLYTVIHRLGLFRVVLFFSLDPLFDQLFGALRVAGLGTFHLDAVWPGVTDQALVSLVIYLLAIDLLNYWIHRGQHQFGWWWKLHSLHHSQRQMTMWSDNRNHLLDDVIRDVLVVMVAHLIGIAPSQFVAIVALTQLSENFQHANVRIWFGRWGERLWISPRFHRLHHSVGIGHESPLRDKQFSAGPPQGKLAPSGGSAAHEVASVGVRLGGSNFGVLLPWWDMLFGTANFELRFDPTGVRDQVEQGRDYGRGFWAQQWLGLKRLAGRA